MNAKPGSAKASERLPPLEWGPSAWPTFTEGIKREWLVANGLGGFAFGTIIGANTRRYHGLLVAALQPPVDRRLLLAKLEEEVCTGAGEVFALGANQYPGVVHPQGFRYLRHFALDPLPTFFYDLQGRFLEKTIWMVYGRNQTAIRYRYLWGDAPLTLRLLPLVTCRDYHHVLQANDWPFYQETPAPGAVLLEAYPGAPLLSLEVSPGRYQAAPRWYYHLEYPVEAERGLEAREDLFNPGVFTLELRPGQSALVLATAWRSRDELPLQAPQAGRSGRGGAPAPEAEAERLREVEARSGLRHPFLRRLVRAGDAFLVRRQSSGGCSLLAGYPWFTDWGRDTMIALPGLALVPRRFAEARSVLETFLRYTREGLLPNLFTDAGGEPEYHAADAPLWFFWTSYKYWCYTHDREFVCEALYPALVAIAEAYLGGTQFGVRVEADGLVAAGEPGWALTWMDARVHGRPVTPRAGKPVEINALWYNALRTLEFLAGRVRRERRAAAAYRRLALRTRSAFQSRFWNEETGYLYDVVDTPEGRNDPALRPNQLLALSLPFAPLRGRPAAAVFQAVCRELLTPYGLRTLSPRHPHYQGRYEGGPEERDAAYHQGTVWPWLWGPFLDAFHRLFPAEEESAALAWQWLAPLRRHLEEGGLGFVAELFDGDPPYTPRGCPAQAWSVAELLRAAVEDLGMR
ncbi:MAG: amylo-alpha-1,6-glucosidase [Bacillota bacterium]|nr:amylo-alpha-1,6-glucosidase [Bacillota bacterium]